MSPQSETPVTATMSGEKFSRRYEETFFYVSRIQPLIILQKKIIRSVCNRKVRDHTSELFYYFNCLKLPEVISLKIQNYLGCIEYSSLT